MTTDKQRRAKTNYKTEGEIALAMGNDAMEGFKKIVY
jgi:hypothetical protein